MKALSILVAALLLPAGAALAQTVLPSGAVAPAGAVVEPSGVTVTPGTIPGSQPLTTSAARSAGARRAKRRDVDAPGMTHQEKKRLRKLSKVKYNSDATKRSE